MSDPTPTEAELRILKVLWEQGPSTARDVLDALEDKEVGYTTVLKTLQIMERKGIARVDRRARAHVYAPMRNRSQTLGRLVRDFVSRVFDGARDEALVHLLQGGRMSESEIRALEKRLEALQAGKGDSHD